MKQRNPFKVFIYSIITLGIYDLYWLETTRKALNNAVGSKIRTIWLFLAPIPVIIAGFAVNLGYASHTNQSSINQVCNTSGFNYTCQPSSSVTITHPAAFYTSLVILIAAALTLIIYSIVWFFQYSKAVDRFTRGKMSTAVAFLVLWIIHLIGVALIQDAYNDVLAGTNDNQATTPAPPQPLPPNPTPTTPPIVS